MSMLTHAHTRTDTHTHTHTHAHAHIPPSLHAPQRATPTATTTVCCATGRGNERALAHVRAGQPTATASKSFLWWFFVIKVEPSLGPLVLPRSAWLRLSLCLATEPECSQCFRPLWRFSFFLLLPKRPNIDANVKMKMKMNALVSN